MLGGVMREHSVKTPNAYYCYFHMEILYVDIYKIVFFWIILFDGYTFYHILEVSYCVIQILMQTVRPRAVLWSVQSK